MPRLPDRPEGHDVAARKALGAFYTDAAVVQFLVSWGMRTAARRVMDPACGDGRFLEAAARLGARQVVACDVDPRALAAARERLRRAGCCGEFLDQDFFAVEPGSLEPVDLIVGNPPFIRYQRFSDRSRRRALASARRVGAKLTRLASSWAPFLLHAMQFLRPGGRLAMVVPAEIAQTQYGLSTLRALAGRFGALSLLTFEENLFADAEEETFLALASDYGKATPEARITTLRSREALPALLARGEEGAESGAFKLGGKGGSAMRLAEAFLSPAERRAWARARDHPSVRPLGGFGVLANGYVTGSNAFFHRTRIQAEQDGYPPDWLRPVARQSRSLRGLFFTGADIEDLEAGDDAHHLLVPRERPGTAARALERLVGDGAARGVAGRFKCRVRRPWWRVKGLVRPDVLLTYMTGARPRAAVNAAGAFHTNSLHGLRLRAGVSPEQVALAFHSSLTLLSLEIEGRSYGGGILKLEPSEMQRVRLAWPDLGKRKRGRLVVEIEDLLRSGEYERAVRVVDDALLIDELGFSEGSVRHLRSARRRLAGRRAGRVRSRAGRRSRS
jgi:methylase of polypeptide subunit release factors